MSGKVRGQLAFASIHDGTDGNGVEYVYLLTDSSTPPSIANNDPYTVTKEGQTVTITYKDDKFCPMSSTGNRCTDHPSGVSLNAKYEWVAVRDKGEPNDKGEREWLPYELVPMVRWSQFGERGTDGDGMEYIFARTTGSTAPTITNDAYNNNPENYLADDFLPHIVGATTPSATDDPQGTSAQYPYEWVMVRSKGSPDESGVRHWNKYTPGTAMAQWSRFANDGNSLVFEPSVINMDDSISVRGQSYVVTGDNDIDGNPTGGYTLDPTKYYCNFGTTLRVYAGKENITRYAVVSVSDSSSISSPARALHHSGTDYYYSIEFPSFSTGEIVPLGFVNVSVAVRANPICGAFSMTERIAWFITQNDKRDKKISSIDFFEEDGDGNVKLKDEYNGLWAAGFVSAGGVGSSGGGGGGIDLDRVWESLTNNTDKPNVKINLAHIPDDERLSYVDPNAGEDITIDDPGTTGTVLWGAESANNVALDVNGVSKILVKQAALDGINSSISNLQSLVATKQDYISDLASIRSNASLGATAYGWGDHSQEGYLKTITSRMIATALGYTPFNASSFTKANIQSTLGISNWALENTKPSYTLDEVSDGSTRKLSDYFLASNFTKANIQSTLGISDWALESAKPSYTFSEIGSTPNTLAGYGITDAKFSSAGVADKIRITLGSNYHDVLTAHQSLSGYATEAWVGQQGFITKAVNDLTNYYLKSQTYTQAEVNALIAAINQFHYEVYPSTSSVTDPQSNVLYLIGPTGSGSDKYEEYVYPNSTTGWTKIGDTSIDLSPYLLASVAAQTYVPLTRTINGHALSSDVTVTKGDVGLDKVDNLAASGYFTEFANGTGSDANKVLITIGGTQKKLTVDYASNADTLDSHDSSYFGKASDVSTLQGYFTNGVANSALRLSGTSTYSIWGVEYWANGVPKSVTGRPNLYIGTTQVQASSAAQALAGITTIAASGLATIQGGISLGGQYNNADSKLVWDETNKAWHLIGNFYADGFITAGGVGSSSGGGGDIDLPRVWESLTNNTDFPNVTINPAHIPDMATTYGYLKGNQTITLTGVVTGSGTTSIATSIADGALSIAKTNGLQAALNAKQDTISDLSTIRTRADEGHTIYGYFSNGVLGLSHIPLDDRLSYVDPEAGEDITIDDPGMTGTVLWGAESANNVVLDVNGVSKTLVKQAALDGVYSSISSLSALIGTKQDYISDLSSIRSNAFLGATAHSWGDHRQAGYLTSVPTASAQTLGVVKVGNGLRIDDGVLSVTGQTQGTVTRVDVGSTAYNPDTNGYVTLPLYAFGTDGTDYVPITIGSTTKNVLTAHQTLPTALKNPYKLTWGTNNEYDGSAAVTITASQLGALTSHQTVTLASGTNNGTLKITTAAGTTDNVAVTGLGTAAYRGIATTIGSSITNLVSGSLLYSVLGDSFDATNNVKAFINSSIATATATYRGNYNVVSDLGGHYNDSDSTIASEIATKMASLSITPDDNDYCFVEIPTSDESGAPISVTKRFKYNGTVWGYEYSLNNSGFTQAQWNALNSGITYSLVTAFNAKYDKPVGGIPKEHLDSSVQTSLGLADTALQSHQAIYGLTINNSAGTAVLSYNPKMAAGSLTLTKAMVGLGNVENFVYNVPTGAEQTYTYPV